MVIRLPDWILGAFLAAPSGQHAIVHPIAGKYCLMGKNLVLVVREDQIIPTAMDYRSVRRDG